MNTGVGNSDICAVLSWSFSVLSQDHSIFASEIITVSMLTFSSAEFLSEAFVWLQRHRFRMLRPMWCAVDDQSPFSSSLTWAQRQLYSTILFNLSRWDEGLPINLLMKKPVMSPTKYWTENQCTARLFWNRSGTVKHSSGEVSSIVLFSAAGRQMHTQNDPRSSLCSIKIIAICFTLFKWMTSLRRNDH